MRDERLRLNFTDDRLDMARDFAEEMLESAAGHAERLNALAALGHIEDLIDAREAEKARKAAEQSATGTDEEGAKDEVLDPVASRFSALMAVLKKTDTADE